jgi:hypothetical protein
MLDEAVELVDVHEHLEANTVGDRGPILLTRPVFSNDRDLVDAATEADVARVAVGWKLEVPLEPERLIEASRPRHIRCEDDGKGAVDDRAIIRSGGRQAVLGG